MATAHAHPAVVAFFFADGPEPTADQLAQWTHHSGSGDVEAVWCTDGRKCARAWGGLPTPRPVRIGALSPYFRKDGKVVCASCAAAHGVYAEQFTR